MWNKYNIDRYNNDQNILTYLESLNTLNSDNLAVTKMALANGYICSGKTEEALSYLDGISKDYSNTEFEKHALLQSAYITFFDLIEFSIISFDI